MKTLVTAKGIEVPCDLVVRSRQYPYLHIHTKSLDWQKASEIFSDQEQTSTLTETDMDTGAVTTYEGYAVLHSIQVSPFIGDEGELMIWLDKPIVF